MPSPPQAKRIAVTIQKSELGIFNDALLGFATNNCFHAGTPTLETIYEAVMNLGEA
jgi:hypothetical protein